MVFSNIDRTLLERCLDQKPGAWNDFVDRFMGLVVHVINHTATIRSIRISQQDRDDLAAEVFLGIIDNDFAVLRRFRGQSSLATYLAVVARRIVVREMLRRKTAGAPVAAEASEQALENAPDTQPDAVQRISSREQVERLLEELEGTEADVLRLYHLEGKSYYEISMATGMPENSIGPMLSRAREKLRQSGYDPATR
ncbi:MAG: sigma-70 family RNA polymerase sigma factor [Planctomycetota bacterium]|nr:MAG: sigma-70 family RNA polymerase sigma factor [Planctomycetota bacterium]REK44644.1 MAG: sigma-70 family RNA polymerase sigma factor [Planctomycetota bacterium]